ncbi:condensation domain-containing protein [Streptomyces sp. NBC_01433]|uniref:condensation domain-containing protein n=1 Tax=Streptomyces sp. NBC_01433 TaxID=2903864 RepID=UPI0022568FDA|nr:condensation domain-containing protein [Streptomyces sp. NBC_01433]MCX4682189.1 condensation domain-containing protein [Streptomyces sp. NBC_01433]
MTPPIPLSGEGDVTELVRGVWASALDRPVSMSDDFFELGGDSLTALAVASAVARVTGRMVPDGWLYRHPRLADAARALLRPQFAATDAPVALERLGRHPVSSQQEGLLSVIGHIGGSHRYQVAYAAALGSSVDLGRLQAAWGRMPQRHPALSTRLVRTADGPAQDVRAAPLPLELVAPSGQVPVGEATDRWASDAIPLDGPLVRVGLVQTAGEQQIVLAAHQLVMDPWSWGLLLADLTALYENPDAGGGPELAYSDYARWQRTHLTGQVLDRHLDFWRDRAEGFPAAGLRLPGAPCPAGPAGPAARLPVQVPGGLVGELEERARAMGASLFEVLLGVFHLAVGQWSGTDDVLVASATASRTVPGVEDVVGFFVNGRFTRACVAAGTVADVVSRVRHSWRAADDHRELHLEKTLFDLGRPDMANIKFSLNTVPGLARLSALGGRRLRAVPVAGTASARRHVSVGLTRTAGALAGAVTYRTDVTDRAAVAALIGVFDQTLRAFAADPGQPVALRRP